MAVVVTDSRKSVRMNSKSNESGDLKSVEYVRWIEEKGLFVVANGLSRRLETGQVELAVTSSGDEMTTPSGV